MHHRSVVVLCRFNGGPRNPKRFSTLWQFLCNRNTRHRATCQNPWKKNQSCLPFAKSCPPHTRKQKYICLETEQLIHSTNRGLLKGTTRCVWGILKKINKYCYECACHNKQPSHQKHTFVLVQRNPRSSWNTHIPTHWGEKHPHSNGNHLLAVTLLTEHTSHNLSWRSLMGRCQAPKWTGHLCSPNEGANLTHCNATSRW